MAWWAKWERCRDKMIRAGLFPSPMLIPTKLFYKEQNVLLCIFMFFSCWENCFHITEAAADKYRKLVIGAGIIAKVRNRWMWSSIKEFKSSSNSPISQQKQLMTKRVNRKKKKTNCKYSAPSLSFLAIRVKRRARIWLLVSMLN